jgi:hypothetical protein
MTGLDSQVLESRRAPVARPPAPDAPPSGALFPLRAPELSPPPAFPKGCARHGGTDGVLTEESESFRLRAGRNVKVRAAPKGEKVDGLTKVRFSIFTASNNPRSVSIH